MNNLMEITYVLHYMWGVIRNKIYNKKIKYWLLPILYLSIILFITNTQKVFVNSVTYTTHDSYTTIEVINEIDKLDYILDNYSLTEYQFKVLVGIVLSEAESNSYEDAYAVINTIYNRTHSKNWVRSVDNHFGKGKGNSLYYQAISPNQFTVYSSGSYKKRMNNTDSVGYNAIIDFLYSEEIMHNYLSFRSHSIKINGSEAFSEKGNNYFNEIKEENRI